jgi:meiotic recombination protein SPO11
MIQIILEIIKLNKHVTKRDIYYSNPPLFLDQKSVDKIIDDLSSLFDTNRLNFNIIASSKGLILGDLSYVEDDIVINCLKFTNGKPISPFVDSLKYFSTSCSKRRN